ncbi:hypothetical protein ACIQPS_35865 [Streptomyces sp. NPDC091290]|uniref:hypothetical protein n=1 Tax=Streptomyces sp. NPDC091290 TaxID=3365990 RepID=UPI0038060F19
MRESTSAATELTSQYIDRVTSDLEHNIKEQEGTAAEITALQQRLAALQHDHTVLVQMQQALGATVTSSASADVDSATMPSPRKRTGGKARQAAGSVAVGKTTTRKNSAERAATKRIQPTLVELVRQHLNAQSEPRSAAEVATALSQMHPDRNIKTTVVRTTLENLVAKNQAQRVKQGGSVFYITPSEPTPPAASTSQDQPETTG